MEGTQETPAVSARTRRDQAALRMVGGIFRSTERCGVPKLFEPSVDLQELTIKNGSLRSEMRCGQSRGSCFLPSVLYLCWIRIRVAVSLLLPGVSATGKEDSARVALYLRTTKQKLCAPHLQHQGFCGRLSHPRKALFQPRYQLAIQTFPACGRSFLNLRVQGSRKPQRGLHVVVLIGGGHTEILSLI